MITTTKKILLSIDFIVQLSIIFILSYSYFYIAKNNMGILANLVVMTLAAFYNPFSNLLHIFLKSPFKIFQKVRLGYLAAVLIYFVILFYIISDNRVPTQTTTSYGDYTNIIVLNTYTLVYAAITFFEFGSMFRRLPEQKKISD